MIELIIAIPILCGVINGRYKEPINNLEKIDKRRHDLSREEEKY